jgi:hypothetical protein
MPVPFSLFMFSANVPNIAPAVEGGAAGFVVDWENQGKAERQNGFDTQINFDTADDLRAVKARTTLPVLCRVNNSGELQKTRDEIDVAIEIGATEILLPMVRSAREVDAVLRHVAGRVPLGILIETPEAVADARALGELPLSRVYVGLQDLAVSRRTRNVFEPVRDGTVERVREHIRVPFGFAGATLPGSGFPIPSQLLFSEFARLGCAFTFLRRSFLADSEATGIVDGLRLIRQAIAEAQAATVTAREASRRELARLIEERSEHFERSGALS